MFGIEGERYLAAWHGSSHAAACRFAFRVALVGGTSVTLLSVMAALVSNTTRRNSNAAISSNLINLRPFRTSPTAIGKTSSLAPGNSFVRPFVVEGQGRLSSESVKPWMQTLHEQRSYQDLRSHMIRAAPDSVVVLQTTDPMPDETVPNDEKIDAIIDAFLKHDITDWKKLMIYSHTWSRIAPAFFRRAEEQAANASGPRRQNLEALLQASKLIHINLEAQQRLLGQLQQCPAPELNGLISSLAQQLSVPEFFEYVQGKVALFKKDGKEAEATALDDLREMISDVLKVTLDGNQKSDLHDGKFVVESKQLESSLPATDFLPASKAAEKSKMFLTGKDTDMTEEEFRDVQMYQYLEMLKANERLLDVEIRLLKKLLSAPDRGDWSYLLEQAFKDPPENYVPYLTDELYTTPMMLSYKLDELLQGVDQMAGIRRPSGLILPGTEAPGYDQMGGYQGLPVSAALVKDLKDLKKFLMKRWTW